MKMAESGKQPLQHQHYPTSPAEYEAELTETEAEYAAEIAELKQQSRAQAQRYLVWGTVSVIVNLSAFYLFNHVLNVEYQIANLLAWILSVQVAFWIDRMIVFKHESDRPFHEMLKFYGTRVLTYILEAVILWLLVSVLTVHPTIAKIVGHGLAVVGNFFLSKLIVFKHPVES
ncbi:teichoic acid glycosylation protein [Lactiplantibacillus fabifermentans T30PCM01]|uniref:Teichoic acid glycosylation protein n=1 Tax=Lactiplantibacillus fabifermentans T30PCM01 TaxID=1400520 RepID=W6T5Y9_9LACO|nr:teichoic acid glycosylation protein [Lactiplantibacillus fabifermentans T30PCM01]